jgi:hypothetical protein
MSGVRGRTIHRGRPAVDPTVRRLWDQPPPRSTSSETLGAETQRPVARGSAAPSGRPASAHGGDCAGGALRRCGREERTRRATPRRQYVTASSDKRGDGARLVDDPTRVGCLQHSLALALALARRTIQIYMLEFVVPILQHMKPSISIVAMLVEGDRVDQIQTPCPINLRGQVVSHALPTVATLRRVQDNCQCVVSERVVAARGFVREQEVDWQMNGDLNLGQVAGGWRDACLRRRVAKLARRVLARAPLSPGSPSRRTTDGTGGC